LFVVLIIPGSDYNEHIIARSGINETFGWYHQKYIVYSSHNPW
jgi:hypothetical protein